MFLNRPTTVEDANFAPNFTRFQSGEIDRLYRAAAEQEPVFCVLLTAQDTGETRVIAAATCFGGARTLLNLWNNGDPSNRFRASAHELDLSLATVGSEPVTFAPRQIAAPANRRRPARKAVAA